MREQVKDDNSMKSGKGVTRRHFVKVAGIATIGVSSIGFPEFYSGAVSLTADPADPVAGSLPAAAGR